MKSHSFKNFNLASQKECTREVDENLNAELLVEKAKKVLVSQKKAENKRKQAAESIINDKEQSSEQEQVLRAAHRRSFVRGSYHGVPVTVQPNGFGIPVEPRPARLPAPRSRLRKGSREAEKPTPFQIQGLLDQPDKDQIVAAASNPVLEANTSRSEDTVQSDRSLRKSMLDIHAPSFRARSPQKSKETGMEPRSMDGAIEAVPVEKLKDVAKTLRDLSSIMDMQALRSNSAPLAENADRGIQNWVAGGSPEMTGSFKKSKKRDFFSVLPSLSRQGIAARQRYQEANMIKNEVHIRKVKAAEKKERLVFKGNELNDHQLHGKNGNIAIAEELMVLKCIMVREQIIMTLTKLLKLLELDYHRHQHYKRKKVKHYQRTASHGERWAKRLKFIEKRMRVISIEILHRQKEVAALFAQLRAASMETVEAVQEWRKRYDADCKGRVYRTSNGPEPKAPTRTFRYQGQNYLLKMQSDLNFLDEFSVVAAWIGFPISGNPLLRPPDKFEWIEELAKIKEELAEKLKAKNTTKAFLRAEQIRKSMAGGGMGVSGSPPRSPNTMPSGFREMNSMLSDGAHISSRPGISMALGLLKDGFFDGFSDDPNFNDPQLKQMRSTGGTTQRNEPSREKDNDGTEESEMSSGMEDVICFPDLVPEQQMVVSFPRELMDRAQRVEKILELENALEKQEIKEKMDKIRRQYESQEILLKNLAQKESMALLLLTDASEHELKESLKQLQQDTRFSGTGQGNQGMNSNVFLTELQRDSVFNMSSFGQGNSPTGTVRMHGSPERGVKFNQNKLKAKMEAEKEAARKLKTVTNKSPGGPRRPKAIKGTFIVPFSKKMDRSNSREKIEAATKIQALARGREARKRAFLIKSEVCEKIRNSSALKIQTSFRRLWARKQYKARRAQIAIQKFSQIKKELRENTAACCIQYFFKNLMVRLHQKQQLDYMSSSAKKFHDQAVRVHNLYRMYNRTRARKMQRETIRNNAATSIQRAVRAHQEYVHQSRNRQKAYSEDQVEASDESDSDLLAQAEAGFVRLQALARARKVRNGYKSRKWRLQRERQQHQQEVLLAAQLAVAAAKQAAEEFEMVNQKLPDINPRFLPKSEMEETKGEDSFRSSLKSSRETKFTRKETGTSRTSSTLPSIQRENKKNKTKTRKVPVQVNVIDLI